MNGTALVAALGALAGVAPELLNAAEELKALFDAKAAGVGSDVLVAAITKLQDEASANKMKNEYPNG